MIIFCHATGTSDQLNKIAISREKRVGSAWISRTLMLELRLRGRDVRSARAASKHRVAGCDGLDWRQGGQAESSDVQADSASLQRLGSAVESLPVVPLARRHARRRLILKILIALLLRLLELVEVVIVRVRVLISLGVARRGCCLAIGCQWLLGLVALVLPPAVRRRPGHELQRQQRQRAVRQEPVEACSEEKQQRVSKVSGRRARGGEKAERAGCALLFL